MKKQKIQLIVLLIAVIVLVGGYYGIQYYNEISAVPEDEKVIDYVVDIDRDSTQKFAYVYEGEEIVLVKEDGVWKYEADPSIPIHQTIVINMERNVEYMVVQEKYENVENLSEYGLDKPERYFSFETADKAYTINVGIRNSYNGDYYIAEPGSNTVYLVDSPVITRFNKSLEDLIDDETKSE